MRKGVSSLLVCAPFLEERKKVIHCPPIWEEWTALLSIAGRHGLPLRVRDFLSCWNLFSAKKNTKILWKAALVLLFWAICKEINKIIFDSGHELSQ